MREGYSFLYYSAYGLLIESNLPLPGLLLSQPLHSPDIRLHLGVLPSGSDLAVTGRPFYVSPAQDAAGQQLLHVWRTPERGFYWRYADTTEFVMDETATHIWARWRSEWTVSDMAMYLLGPVLGFALRLRGAVCLHASAVAINHQAVALLGPAGAGKSTTAAAFNHLGYASLSDDVLVLDEVGTRFMVRSAYPCLRLWPESVVNLYGVEDALPRLTPTWDKRGLDTERGLLFQTMPLPLGAIYLLGERTEEAAAPWVESTAPSEALIWLIGNSYVGYLLDGRQRGHEFQVLSRLVASVPVRRVIPHADPQRLRLMCETIVGDFRALSRAAQPVTSL